MKENASVNVHEVLSLCISIQIKKKIIIDIPTKTNKVQRDKLVPKRNDLLSYPTSNGPNIYPTQPIQIGSFIFGKSCSYKRFKSRSLLSILFYDLFDNGYE